MTTNEIEKQLRLKSRKEIDDLVTELVGEIRRFKHEGTGLEGRGVNWYSKHTEPTTKYAGKTMPDPSDFFDWGDLRKLFKRNLEEAMLDGMVSKKTEELLKKVNLLG